MNRSVEDGSHINDESPKYPYSNQYNQYYKNPIGINQFERKQAPWAKLRAIFIFILVLFLIGIYLGCFIGGSRLESFYFTYDSEAEIDENLIDTLYNNLDQDSRLNITNETYSLLLVIQDLDFIQRFDYLFVITGGNITNLRIAPRNGINRVSSFESRGSRNPYNLSIEFRINSTDPDISNVLVFPPDNVINGNLYGIYIYSSPNNTFFENNIFYNEHGIFQDTFDNKLYIHNKIR